MKVLYVVVFLMLCQLCYSQRITLDRNGRNHDFRGVIANPGWDHFTDQFFGVRGLSISYEHCIYRNFNLGFGIAHENSKTIGSLNPNASFKSINSINYLNFKKSQRYFVIIPLSYETRIKGNFYGGVQGRTFINVYRKFVNTAHKPKPFPTYTQSQIYLNHFELIPQISYKVKRWGMQLGYRLINISKVDKMIFFKEFFDTHETRVQTDIYNQDIDMYNPFKIYFSVLYSLK